MSQTNEQKPTPKQSSEKPRLSRRARFALGIGGAALATTGVAGGLAAALSGHGNAHNIAKANKSVSIKASGNHTEMFEPTATRSTPIPVTPSTSPTKNNTPPTTASSIPKTPPLPASLISSEFKIDSSQTFTGENGATWVVDTVEGKDTPGDKAFVVFEDGPATGNQWQAIEGPGTGFDWNPQAPDAVNQAVDALPPPASQTTNPGGD